MSPSGTEHTETTGGFGPLPGIDQITAGPTNPTSSNPVSGTPIFALLEALIQADRSAYEASLKADKFLVKIRKKIISLQGHLRETRRIFYGQIGQSIETTPDEDVSLNTYDWEQLLPSNTRLSHRCPIYGNPVDFQYHDSSRVSLRKDPFYRGLSEKYVAATNDQATLRRFQIQEELLDKMVEQVSFVHWHLVEEMTIPLWYARLNYEQVLNCCIGERVLELPHQSVLPTVLPRPAPPPGRYARAINDQPEGASYRGIKKATAVRHSLEADWSTRSHQSGVAEIRRRLDWGLGMQERSEQNLSLIEQGIPKWFWRDWEPCYHEAGPNAIMTARFTRTAEMIAEDRQERRERYLRQHPEDAANAGFLQLLDGSGAVQEHGVEVLSINAGIDLARGSDERLKSLLASPAYDEFQAKYLNCVEDGGNFAIHPPWEIEYRRLRREITNCVHYDPSRSGTYRQEEAQFLEQERSFGFWRGNADIQRRQGSHEQRSRE